MPSCLVVSRDLLVAMRRSCPRRIELRHELRDARLRGLLFLGVKAPPVRVDADGRRPHVVLA
jgi:hypothetical protein